MFDTTQRPDSDLLYHRNDLNDVRLGELVQTDPHFYQQAEVVLLGCPQDDGVRRNQGRLGARLAPDAIRRCFYRLTPGMIPPHKVFDLGNTIIQTTLEETHDTHREIVQRVIRDGKILIVLGGGNDTSYPDCSGLAMASSSVLAFNVDAHFDVRADAVRNSGTPYRQLLEEGFVQPGNFYEIGHQPFSNSPVYHRYLTEKGVNVYSREHLQEVGVHTLFHSILHETTDVDAIFWGIDLDVVQAADAPGVSAPNPTGLRGEELCQIALLAGQDRRTRLIEFTEVNPEYDLDQRTCRLTAVAMFYFLQGVFGR